MIKYVELTAPQKGEYRQAKILSVEVNEGDTIAVGDILFRVKSGENEIDLPSTKAGKVTEIIAYIDENITLSTALILLETNVEKETKPEPVPPKKISKKKAGKKTKKKASKKKTPTQANNEASSAQQQLLLGDLEPEHEENQKSTESSNLGAVDICIPDLGVDSATVVEIFIKAGDIVALEDPLLSLESDKANMEFPSPFAGKIVAVLTAIDDDVTEGTVVANIITEQQDGQQAETKTPDANKVIVTETKAPNESATTKNQPKLVDVKIPDIGGDAAKVIEILVTVEQQIDIDDDILTLESDKASMDVPSPVAGIIKEINAAVDDDVNEGDIIIKVLSEQLTSEAETITDSQNADTAQEKAAAPKDRTVAAPQAKAAPIAANSQATVSVAAQQSAANEKSHATPSVRRFARELGVNLGQFNGTGRKGRISKDDVKQFVKGVLTNPAQAPAATSGSGIPAIPDRDFAKFGSIENQQLNKIKRLTATYLHRAWVNIPHVTHHDEANSTQIDVLRKGLKEDYAREGIKISPLVFVIKACVAALKEFPAFNSSLHSSGDHLIVKNYYHIGIAVDTPNGLVVPVIRDADQKNIKELSVELSEISKKARDKKLTPKEMQGGTFSISSLGGIGGRFFTPIVNAPEVAILGVCRTKVSPYWNGSEFIPVPMLPLSLSYDHRVIDGAEAARFSAFICQQLAEFSLTN